jgi:hypothetical protein
MHVWPFYGLMTVGAIMLARHGQKLRRSEDSLGAAFLLGGLWLAWNLSHWFMPEPYNQYFPLLDSVTCVSLIWLWRTRYRAWKVCLILLFFIESLIHADYFAVGDHSHAARYAYDLKQNLIYIGQLACVSVFGVRLVVWGRR